MARGDRVIATGRTKEKIDQLVLGVKPELIDNLRTVLLDVTQGEEALKIKMDKAEFWGGIDVLVNNAGKRFVNDGKIGVDIVDQVDQVLTSLVQLRKEGKYVSHPTLR